MKKILLIIPLLTLILTGCSSNYLTNEEIVNQVKYCENNGLKADDIHGGWTNGITEIMCVPKD